MRRCRNEGGTEFSFCTNEPLQEGLYGQEYKDTGCGKNKPLLRFCHIPALNGPSNETHFAFSKYSYFTADSARSVCNAVGGSVPSLDEELNSAWLGKAIHNVGTYVNIGWPFSLRWLAWPVSQTIYHFRLRNNFLDE